MKESRVVQPFIGESAPTIEFGHDATWGTYISRLTLGDMSWNLAPAALVRMALWDTVAEAEIEIVDGSFDVAIDADEITGVVTLVFTHEDYVDVTFTATMTPAAFGYRVSYVANNVNATHGLVWAEFPILGCQPPSANAANAWLSHGFVGGLVLTRPYAVEGLDTAPNMMHSPSSMQFMDYFDHTTKAHLYLATDDLAGYSKGWPVTGDGSYVTTIGSRHYFPNPRRGANAHGDATDLMPYTVPYGLTIEMFRGQTTDGRCGHYDSALRYRSWVLQANPPWIANGPWVDDSNISQLVKDADFLYVTGGADITHSTTPWTDFVADMVKVKDFVEATDMLSIFYTWARNMDFTTPGGFLPQAFTPLANLADQATAVVTANSNDIHISYYTLPVFWDSTLNSGVFNFYGFNGSTFYDDLTVYSIRDHTEALVQNPGSTLLSLDLANYLSTVREVQKDVFVYDGTGSEATVFGYYWQLGLPFNGPWIRGYYYDLFGGGGNLSTYQTSQTLNTNGNSPYWEPNKAELASFARDAVRTNTTHIDPDFYTSTENVEEGLIGALDYAHLGQIGELPAPRDWGILGGQFGIVYSRYQCFFTLGITLNDASLTGTTQDFYYASWLNAMFHQTGGKLQLNNNSRSNGDWLPVVPFVVAPGICPLFITLTFCHSAITKMNATEVIRLYMRKGLRMRPLPQSWEGDYMESGTALSTFLAGNAGVTADSPVASSSVWWNPDPDPDFTDTNNCLGIVITSTYTADLVYNIHMDAECYDLDPTRTYVLYERFGNGGSSTRTELTRFTGVLDYDYTLVFDFTSAPVVLLEVVLLGDPTPPIDDPPIPMITVTAPLPGSIHAAGTPLLMTWTVVEPVAPTALIMPPVWQLFAYDDDLLIAVLDPEAVEVSPGNWEADFTIPSDFPAGAQYNIVIRDDVTNVSAGSGNFEVTPTGLVEVVTVLHPDAAETVTPFADFEIEWTTNALGGSPAWLIECYRLTVLVDTPSNYVTIVDNGAGNYTAVWNPPPALGDGTASYHLKITNAVTGVSDEGGVFTLDGLNPAEFTTAPVLAAATIGVPYTDAVAAIGGNNSFTYALEAGSTLPAGLALNTGTGDITGTPTGPAAVVTFDITALDSSSLSVTQTFSIAVSTAAPTQLVITTTTLPGATVGIPYFVQLTQLYGTAPTWGAAPLPAGLSLNAALGQISGTPTTPDLDSVVLTLTEGGFTAATPVTLTLVVNPALEPGSAQITFSDGFTVTVSQGQNLVLTNGYSNGVQTLDLTAGPLKIAPNGSPGIRVYCVPQGNALRVGFKNTGRGRQSGSGLAQPIYFIRVVANMPDRVVPYGETFRWVRPLGGGQFTLVESTDPKHPCAQAMWTGGGAYDAAYVRTTTEHWADGGMGAEWLFVPDTDPIEQSAEPTAAAQQMARDVFDFDLPRIATFPIAKHFIDLYKTDALQDNNPGLPRPQMREAWMMYGENIATHGFNGGVLAGAAPHKRLMDWHHGMSIWTVATGANTNGHYNGNLWWGVRYLLQSELGILDAASAYESFAMGLGISRQSIRCGFWMNEVTDTNNKGRHVNEQSSQWGGFLAQRGASGSLLAPGYDKEYDWPALFYLIMRPDDQLHQEWYSYRLNRFLTTTPPFAGNANINIGGCRHGASYLRGLLFFYRYCLATGDTTSAAALRAKAQIAINAMYQNGNYPNAYPTPMFTVASNQPHIAPWSPGGQSFTSGAMEGLLAYICKWVFDYGTNDGDEGFADLRQHYKDSALWHLIYMSKGIGTGLADWAYTWQIDTTPTTPPPGANATYYGNINVPLSTTHLGPGEQGTYLFPLLPRLLAWFPGYVLPGGATIEQRCANIVNCSYNHPNYSTPATMGAAWYGIDNYNWPKTHRFFMHGLPRFAT